MSYRAKELVNTDSQFLHLTFYSLNPQLPCVSRFFLGSQERWSPAPRSLSPSMADQKRLAYSIIQFLHTQLQSGSMSPDAQESLEGEWVGGSGSVPGQNLGEFGVFFSPVFCPCLAWAAWRRQTWLEFRS